jgi:murein DD-endopeptidase MepM/ murein hydrolase activator NlpD
VASSPEASEAKKPRLVGRVVDPDVYEAPATEGGIPNGDDPFDWLGSSLRGSGSSDGGEGPRADWRGQGSAPAPRRRAPRKPANFGALVRPARRYPRVPWGKLLLVALGIVAAGVAVFVLVTGEGGGSDDAETAALTPPSPPMKPIVKPWRIADVESGPAFRKIQGRIGKKPFLTSVQDAGLSRNQAYAVLNAFKGIRNLDRCRPDHRFSVLINRETRQLDAFEFIVSGEEIYQVRRKPDGLLVANQLDMQVGSRVVQGAIRFDRKTFSAAAKAHGFNPKLATVVAKALRGHLSLAELRGGDVLKVVAQEVSVLGEFSRYSGVQSIEYVPVSGNPLRVYYFRGDKSRGYFDQRGRAPDDNGWRKPIAHARISSRFNPHRMHPVLKRRMPHNGTDFAAPTGTPVRASSYGTVTHVGYKGPSGNLVVVKHPSGYETGYAHLSRFAPGIHVGDKIRRLELVGYVGSTGRSTGPHLHFSAKRNGRFIDAESLNLDGMRRLPRAERDAFSRVRAEHDALLDAIPALPPPTVAAPAAAAAPPTEDPQDFSAGGGSVMVEAGAAPAPTNVPSPMPAADLDDGITLDLPDLR